jgi:hypothetical protein
MALSTISTISIMTSSSTSETFRSFIFPDDIANIDEITSPTYEYTGGHPWQNGNYLIMSQYYAHSFPAHNIFALNNLKRFNTSILNQTQQTLHYSHIYNSTTDSVVVGPSLGYTRSAYNSFNSGSYQGGTQNIAQNVTTLVKQLNNTTSTISGDYIQVKFPFVNGFIIEKIFFYNINYGVSLPKRIYIVGSNDGTNWNHIHRELNIPGSTYVQNSLSQVVNITGINITPYKHHRIIFEQVHGGHSLAVGRTRIEGKVLA